MRCHINCCSWKNRPPFSASARHLCAPSGIPPLLRSFSLSGDSPTLVYRSLGVQGAPSIHSVRVRLPGWVTMATHSLRLCHVNSSPSFFPIPLSHKKRKEKSWTTAENTPCRRMTEQGHKLRGCRSCFLFLSPVIVLSFPSPGSSCPYFSSVQERQLCVISSRWSPEEREREKRKKTALRGLELTAQASSGTGCRCVYVCMFVCQELCEC